MGSVPSQCNHNLSYLAVFSFPEPQSRDRPYSPYATPHCPLSDTHTHPKALQHSSDTAPPGIALFNLECQDSVHFSKYLNYLEEWLKQKLLQISRQPTTTLCTCFLKHARLRGLSLTLSSQKQVQCHPLLLPSTQGVAHGRCCFVPHLIKEPRSLALASIPEMLGSMTAQRGSHRFQMTVRY